MKRTILIVGIVLGVILEVLVLAAIYDTKHSMSGGGDVFHNTVDKLPMKIDGQDRVLSKGTYVVTGEGPVLLTWYWVYEYSYITALIPILAVVAFSWLYSRGPKQSQLLTKAAP